MKLLKLPNRIRRKVMQAVDKSYIDKKFAKRKGECLKCGKCCGKCKHLDEGTKLCRVYDERPWFCHRDFPIDKMDQKVFGVRDCGYNFEHKN